MDKLTVYLPTKDGNGSPLPESQIELNEDRVARMFSRLCGGCTIQYGQGCWTNEKGKLIKESIILIYSFGDFNNARLTAVLAIVATIGTECHQEAMAYELNGQFNLISDYAAV